MHTEFKFFFFKFFVKIFNFLWIFFKFFRDIPVNMYMSADSAIDGE